MSREELSIPKEGTAHAKKAWVKKCDALKQGGIRKAAGGDRKAWGDCTQEFRAPKAWGTCERFKLWQQLGSSSVILAVDDWLDGWVKGEAREAAREAIPVGEDTGCKQDNSDGLKSRENQFNRGRLWHKLDYCTTSFICSHSCPNKNATFTTTKVLWSGSGMSPQKFMYWKHGPQCSKVQRWEFQAMTGSRGL